MDEFQSGFISIIGPPNVGKSTLLNRILGTKITITSDKPQTTRNRILGIKNLKKAQLIFFDTPGIYQSKSLFGKSMVHTALATCKDVDLILLMAEANHSVAEEDHYVLEFLSKLPFPVILLINKVDRVKKENLLPLIDAYSQLFGFSQIIPISALSGDGIDRLMEEILRLLPKGPQYFPEDMITDQPERFIVSEMIRETVIVNTYQEIPYSIAVSIEEFKEKEDRNLIVIRAIIHVEKLSQKGIIIGKKGAMLKKIGSDARKKIEDFLGVKVYLDCWVNVERNWSKDRTALKKLGYR
ncbi:MAG: GTPase Era [Syntrophobacterales bacterium]|nr:MAG: GTPase Era [Syntrophobacterales bacterium]